VRKIIWAERMQAKDHGPAVLPGLPVPLRVGIDPHLLVSSEHGLAVLLSDQDSNSPHLVDMDELVDEEQRLAVVARLDEL